MNLKGFFSSFAQWIKKNKSIRRLQKKIPLEMQWINESLAKMDVQEAKKGTLIVKCDDIGDFLIWQNVIPSLLENAEKPICFVGNVVIKSLLEDYFDFADEYIWVDKSKWHQSDYRLEIYKKTRLFNSKLALEPMFSRHFEMDDMILYASSANVRMAWDISLDPHFNQLKGLDAITSQTVHSVNPILLEYARNFEFISKVFNVDLDESFKAKFPAFNKKKTLVVVPVGSLRSKNWDPLKYAELITKIEYLFDSIVLLGGENALATCQVIESNCNSNKILNLCKQTKLSDAFAFIGEASLLICPDTFSVHTAVMTKTDVIVLSNAMNWQRFLNYESIIDSKIELIFPKGFKKNPNVLKKTYNRSEIQTIEVETVVKAVKKIIG